VLRAAYLTQVDAGVCVLDAPALLLALSNRQQSLHDRHQQMLL
jgi:hypothetical protein